MPVLLLDHIGRKSKRRFTTPLLHLRHGPDIIVVGSQGGQPRHPQWYLNLMENSDTSVQIGPSRIPVRARTASAAERARLWPLLVSMYAGFAAYQSWTSREIPVVILSPISSPNPPKDDAR